MAKRRKGAGKETIEQGIKRCFAEFDLAYAGLKEHGLDFFEELARENPEEAIKQFPEYLDKVLSINNHMFSGLGCGGPAPEATVPLLNAVGSFYARLPKPVRRSALERCMGFLDGLNYVNAQNNVEMIHEPWLVSDITLTRPLYWCGYAEYVGALKDAVIWEDIKPRIMTKIPTDFASREFGLKEEEHPEMLNVRSAYWFAFTLARAEHTRQGIREKFEELFPEVMDRTKDGCAALIAHHSAVYELGLVGEKRPYREVVEEKLTHYVPEYKTDLIRKINEKKWIMLPDAYHPDEKGEQLIAFLDSDASIIR